MSKHVLRSEFNYDGDVVSFQTGLECPEDEGMTQQQFKVECDINEIVRRFGVTGELPNGVAIPLSGDFTQVTDYHTALNLVRKSDEAFLELPAHVRERFSNDPGRLLSFLDDPANRDEAIRLGVVAKPAEVTRDAVMAIDELAKALVPPKV